LKQQSFRGDASGETSIPLLYSDIPDARLIFGFSA
jgi:hypothetical protein